MASRGFIRVSLFAALLVLAFLRTAAGEGTQLAHILSPKAGTYAGEPAAILFDVLANRTSRVNLRAHEDRFDRSPKPDRPINNIPNFAFPSQPPDPRIVKINAVADGRPTGCTGSVIHKNVILTAGHCIHGGQNGEFFTNVRVIPGFDAGRAPYGTFESKTLIAFSGWIETSDNAHDIGVIVLRQDLPAEIGAYGYASFGSQCPTPQLYRKKFYSDLIGDGQLQYKMQGKRFGCHLGLFFNREPWGFGSSGSPDFPFNNENIYAVTSANDPNFGFSARLTKAKLRFIVEKLIGGVFP